MGIFDGIGQFLQNSKGQGNFTQRLGTFGARLQDMGDGGNRANTMEDRLAAQMEQQQKLAQQRALMAKADELGLTPKEKFLFMVNPQAFGNLLAEQGKPFTLDNQRYGPDGKLIAEAPKHVQMGDSVVGITSQGATPEYTRGPTISEMLAKDKFSADEVQRKVSNGFEGQRIGIARGQLGVSQGQLGVSRGNLGLSREKFNREPGGGDSSSLPPGYRPRR